MSQKKTIKGNKVIPYTQRIYKVGYAPGVYGLWSEESLYTRITPPIKDAIEYSHDRILYLSVDNHEN